MRAAILDGSQANDKTAERVRAALMTELQTRGCQAEHFLLRTQKIGACAGDFFCWVRSPGVCNINDDNRRIAEAVTASDLLVLLTPVTFGGYSSALKKMVDHLIQNISPFFARVDGQTHHKRRYDKYPDFLVVGWMESPNPQAEAVFRHLARRNSINFFAGTEVGDVVYGSQSDGELAASAKNWFGSLQGASMLPEVNLPKTKAPPNVTSAFGRALLVVGSPKTIKSTSLSLGGYLFEQFDAQTIRTETVYVHNTIRSPEKMKALLGSIDSADLVTLAFPLYVDSLPAPVIEAMEIVAAHRQSRTQTHRTSFAAIVNCGFPEADQNATALAICKTFAEEAEFDWAGSLELGGGGMVSGTPLAAAGGRTIRIRRALELAAAALAQGQPIPQAARDLMAKPVIPAWAYRFMGDFGWRQQAKRYGAGKMLKRRAYQVGNE